MKALNDYMTLLPVALGALAMILNCTTWAIVRKLTYRRARRSTLCCCAWTSVCSSLILFAAGGFTIWVSVAFDAGSSWIGFVVVLSGLYWMIQAMKYHKMAKTPSAGYQPFNEPQQSVAEEEPRRRSNAPLIVEVDSNNNSHHPMSLEPNMSSTMSPVSSAAKSRYSQPLIRNAVPPSPFIGTQGTDSYVAIPMSITKPQPRSDYGTPQGRGANTLNNLEEEEEDDEDSLNDTLTEPHAEDSIYIEEVEEEDVDGKQEEEKDVTLGGPERKTSEGNDTHC